MIKDKSVVKDEMNEDRSFYVRCPRCKRVGLRKPIPKDWDFKEMCNKYYEGVDEEGYAILMCIDCQKSLII